MQARELVVHGSDHSLQRFVAANDGKRQENPTNANAKLHHRHELLEHRLPLCFLPFLKYPTHTVLNPHTKDLRSEADKHS